MQDVTLHRKAEGKGLRSHEGLLAEVGNTPIIPLSRVAEDLTEHVELWVKAEWFNPSGSVKDRPAAAILQHALKTGELGQGRILLDSSSGNMGIAYATFAANLGIPVEIALPANASQERIQVLRSLGAALTLTDPLEGSDGARVVAGEMARRHPDRYYYADQYSNPANWQSHYRTTGPELVRQTQGRLTHFVVGLGTSGTLMGTGRYLKERDASIQLIAVQPEGPMHGLEGLKHMDSSPHPPIFNPQLADRTVKVATEVAYGMARRLAKEEGLLIGLSAAGVVQASLELAHRIERGTVVALCADSGLKYLSEPFWSQG
jgi:cysteine synthase B